MPNCYFDVAIISRGSGSSAVGTAAYDSGTKLSSTVASAAYRSGEALYDSRAGKTFDYRHKDDVLHTEIIAPHYSPDWVQQRGRLWNQVEASEKRKDAQLARSIIAALPRELSTQQNIALAREFVMKNFTSQGMIADLAVHDKDSSDGGRNPHVHIMLTMRGISPAGFDAKKNRAWNNPKLVSLWRDSWEDTTNRFLEAAGRSERVSLKSYKEQGIDKTPQTHMGYAADKLEKRRRVETQPGNQNRKVKQDNLVRDVKRSRLPEPYARDSIEDWHHSRWEWMNRLFEPNVNASSADREGMDRRIVAEAEQASWLGTRTNVTLYYHGQEENDDPARHLAVLEKVLGDNRLDTPIRLAETVNRLNGAMHESNTEPTWDYSLMNRERYEDRYESSRGQEREH